MTTNSGFWCPTPRDVVEVSGPDAGSYLQSQVSQDLRPLSVGGSMWTFLLQPTGRVEVLARVWRIDEATYTLDTDAGFGDALTARVNRFRIRVKAEVAPLAWTCLAVRGVERTGEEGVVAWGSGYDLLGLAPVPPAGIAGGDASSLLAARIDAVWPAMGTEIVPGETIPAETGITDRAVSFTKGCYPGQELVERMDSRAATAPKLLQRLSVAEAEAIGARVTSRHGDTVLAYVPRSALAH